jgi:hypothetical protein
MRSPGVPSHRRKIEGLFWEQIATGITSARAAEVVRVSQALGARFTLAGRRMVIDLDIDLPIVLEEVVCVRRGIRSIGAKSGAYGVRSRL